MLWIHAKRHIAFVQNPETVRDWTFMNFPRYVMSLKSRITASPGTKNAIWPFATAICPLPKPARICLENLRPEAISNWGDGCPITFQTTILAGTSAFAQLAAPYLERLAALFAYSVFDAAATCAAAIVSAASIDFGEKRAKGLSAALACSIYSGLCHARF